MSDVFPYIIAVLVFGGLFLFMRCTKPDTIEKIVRKFSLSPVSFSYNEKKFSKMINKVSPNDLIADGNASDVCLSFVEYWDQRGEIPKEHFGFPERRKEIEKLGGKNVAEVYVAGITDRETGLIDLETSLERLLGSPKHNKIMRGNYTHYGLAIVNKQIIVIYFNIK